MRISIFGNTNNYPLRLAVALRTMGVYVDLFVNQKHLLHRPESVIKSWSSGYPNWVHDISSLDENDFVDQSRRIAPVLDLMDAADGLILNHIGPSLSGYFNKPSIAFLTGSDLTFYASHDTEQGLFANCSYEWFESAAGKLISKSWREFVNRQQQGIRDANFVLVMPPGAIPAHDDLLSLLGVPDSKRDFFAMANLPALRPIRPASMDTIRLFNAARLTWKKPYQDGETVLDHKGTDIMLHGVAQFRKETTRRVELRLVRKGRDIKATEDLVRELGLVDIVTWLDELSLMDFYREVALSTAVFDQMADSLPGMSTFDSLALGRPVIANGRPDIPALKNGVCQASTSSEISMWLHRINDSNNYLEDFSKPAHEFAQMELNPVRFASQAIRALGLELPKAEQSEPSSQASL
jgi:hypothetical protein